MAQQSPDWKALYYRELRERREEQRGREEEQRRREEAEQAQKEAEQAQEEAEQAREGEQRRRQEAEEKTRKTTLAEFLDACHNHLHLGLTVQTDANLSTRGDPANANNKLRPDKLLIWEDFPEHQDAIWGHLMKSDFVLERLFTSVHTLEESGASIQQRMLSSELDLHLFQRYAVEDPVSLIIKQLYNDRALRQRFRLQGSVSFENHANTLSPELQLEESMEQISITGNPRRRSPRLQAKAREAKSTDRTESAAATRAEKARSSRSRADQFCVYNAGTQNTENHIAAFIMEYKAPHKLPLGFIYEGLEDIELEDVIRCRETETPQDHFRRLIAAVITQAFSYMVNMGLEYGCVCTGEAFIFLRVPDDPKTVYYFLSVPKGDVGETTGWALDSGGPNRLHLTAVGQMLAFTLQALKTPPRSQRWRADAAAQLDSWQVVYDDLLDTIPLEDAPSSEYRPPRHDRLLRTSPIQLRRRPTPTRSPSCWRPQDQHEASDEEPDPNTPSRQRSSSQGMSRTQAAVGSSSHTSSSRSGARSEQYCTQNCLRGLVEGGALDLQCPNVRGHGIGYHQIDQPTFLTLVRQQLSEDLDTDCKPVGMPGACGVPFLVRLKSYGYTIIAKSTCVDFIRRLKREAAIYERLRPIQGINVPVHLGNIDLKTPYFYKGIELVHMMFLSFGGKLISQHLTAENRSSVARLVDSSDQAIRECGVLHTDLMPRNILWNEETGRVMVIDFERAEVVRPRTVLGIISANGKRKRGSEGSTMKSQGGGTSASAQKDHGRLLNCGY